MKTSRIVSCFSFFAMLPVAGSAQRLTFGVEGGVPALIPLGQSSSKIPFAVGPTVTVRLFDRLSLQSGLLYYRLGERSDTAAFQYPEKGLTLLSETRRGSAIEIPLLLKYTLLSNRRQWRPFVSAGPALRRTSLDYERVDTVWSQSTTRADAFTVKDQSARWKVDPVASAGISFQVGRMHFEPQVRYSYWNAGKDTVVLKNQVHVMFGFRF